MYVNSLITDFDDASPSNLFFCSIFHNKKKELQCQMTKMVILILMTVHSLNKATKECF